MRASYRLVLHSIHDTSRLKEVVLALQQHFGIDRPTAIDWLKHLPLTLVTNCSEVNAKKLQSSFSELGARIRISPSLDETSKKAASTHLLDETVLSSRNTGEKARAGLAFSVILITMIVLVFATGLYLAASWIWGEESMGRDLAEDSRARSKAADKSLPKTGTASPSLRDGKRLLLASRDASGSWHGADAKAQGEERRLLAIKLLRQAAREAPGADAWKWLGIAHSDMGQADSAERAFRQALEHAPKDIELLNHLGTSLVDQRRTEEAVEVLEAAVEAAPSSALTRKNLGTILFYYQEDTTAALEHWQRYLAAPLAHDVELPHIRAETLKSLWARHFPVSVYSESMDFGRYEAKRQRLADKLAKREDAETLWELGALYLGRGMTEDARDAWRRAHKLSPANLQICDGYMRISVLSDQFATAANVLERPVREGTMRREMLLALALLKRYGEGDTKMAGDLLTQYLRFPTEKNSALARKELNAIQGRD